VHINAIDVNTEAVTQAKINLAAALKAEPASRIAVVTKIFAAARIS